MARRHAALGFLGDARANRAAFDGEVCVCYEAVHRRVDPAAGVRRLLLAVLEDGIRTLLKHACATRGRAFNLRNEALQWLTAGERRHPFAFESICEALGIDAVRLRARVLVDAGSAGHAAQ